MADFFLGRTAKSLYHRARCPCVGALGRQGFGFGDQDLELRVEGLGQRMTMKVYSSTRGVSDLPYFV